MCILTSILFLGGYLFNPIIFIDVIEILNIKSFFFSPLLEGMIFGMSLAIKTCIMVFTFIWVRASLPRIRFDHLMLFC
jgi:NADH-ubiquinone oxidoreductase chain 1